MHEVKYFNGKVYAVVEVGHVNAGIGDALKRDVKTTAGAVLFAFDVALNRWSVVKTYNYVMDAARSFTVHQNALYFIEKTDAATHYSPSNENLPGWDANTRANATELNKVFLYRLDGVNPPKPVMSPWFDEKYFVSTAVPMLSDGANLHIIGRYSDKYDISRQGSDASKANNEAWLVYGYEIQPYLEQLAGTIYRQLLNITKAVGGTLQLNETVRVLESTQQTAFLSAALTDAAASLGLTKGGEAFGTSGVLLIDQELVSYTGRTGNTFSGLTRGMHGSVARGTHRGGNGAGDRYLYF